MNELNFPLEDHRMLVGHNGKALCSDKQAEFYNEEFNDDRADIDIYEPSYADAAYEGYID